MDITKLLEDYNVPYWTSGKNISDGWIGIQCPFCNDHSNHLGFHLTELYFNCWRCGSKKTFETLSKLLSISEKTAREIARKYGAVGYRYKPPPQDAAVRIHAHVLPSNTGPVQKQHVKYLASRRYDPDKIVSEWSLLGTGPIALLDGIDYKHRIIAPIMWHGERVSFQARDITNQASLKYLTCPKNRELVHHKHILYGDQTKWGDIGICVEGTTDVWRFGPRAFATFGAKYTYQQMLVMASTFKRVIIVFDEDVKTPDDKKLAYHGLVSELRFRGVSAQAESIRGDPGDMGQDDADHFVRLILRRA